MAQAAWVAESLKTFVPDLEIETQIIKTLGDSRLDDPVAELGGKGVFVTEIENALLNKEIDLAVHSMKDLPMELPPGLHIAAIPKRLDPRDVFVSAKYRYLSDLPKNGSIGTGSPRRKSQILNYRSDINVLPLRGNVDTRIKKLESGEYDAIILARAGLERLQLSSKINAIIGINVMLPAAGQGALAVETREDNDAVNVLLQSLHDEDTAICVNTERAFMHYLGGGCNVAAGALCEFFYGNLNLNGFIADPHGHTLIKENMVVATGSSNTGARKLAERLLEMGGAQIMAEHFL